MDKPTKRYIIKYIAQNGTEGVWIERAVDLSTATINALNAIRDMGLVNLRHLEASPEN